MVPLPLLIQAKYLHFFSLLKSLVLLFCHQLHSYLSLQQLDASVAQVFAHKVLQVQPCWARVPQPTPWWSELSPSRNREITPSPTPPTSGFKNLPPTRRGPSPLHHTPYPWPTKPRGRQQSLLALLRTREIRDEDHLGVVVQAALDFL